MISLSPEVTAEERTSKSVTYLVIKDLVTKLAPCIMDGGQLNPVTPEITGAIDCKIPNVKSQ